MTLRKVACSGLLAALVYSGCSTFQHGGGMQKVWIDSRPPGATVLLLPDEILFDTPGEIRLERRYARTLRVELEGYCRETVYIDRIASWATVFGGPVGLWIDRWTGAAYTLRPERFEVILWPEDSPDRECGPARSMPRKTPLPPLEPL